MFYNNSCMQYIASGALLTAHIYATNEKKTKQNKVKQCKGEDALQERGNI